MKCLTRKQRHGVSIMEVLFAIMISAIGLMGAIAVFPAALLQVKRGQQADSTSAAGIRVTHDFDAMGMRRADRWLTYNGSAYVNVPTPDGSFAYCIDPRFIAANQNDSSANNFPYGATTSVMQRVTLNNGATGSTTPMSPLLAELHFRIEDDLKFHRFTGQLNGIDVDRTMHSESKFVVNTSNNALKRETEGHMSWMATLAPKLERMPTGGVLEDRYTLSTVIFYDRPAQLQASGGYLPSDWSLNVNMAAPYGGGIGGGDMVLSETSTSLTAEERLRRLNINRDQWIMLISYSQISGRTSPLCRWYRVADADEPDSSAYTVNVTLAGADWENTGQPTYAVVAQGVVAVYEKTIKLEPRN